MQFENLPRMLLEKGIWLQDGRKFGNSGKGFMRMNIATPKSILEEALSRIIQVFNND